MKGWAQEQEEMTRAANMAMRGCGLLALVVAIIIAAVFIIISIL
jgi:hypothetical protein